MGFCDMGRRNLAFFLIFSLQLLHVLSETDGADVAALHAIQSSWKNLPPNWKGPDPCGRSWEGVKCNGTRVTSLVLAGQQLSGSSISDVSGLTGLEYLDLSNNVGLKAPLPSSFGTLKNLTVLILVGCRFFGRIPDSIGSLPNLVYISLNSNDFTGPIPPSMGNLSKLSWLDLSDNKLNGTIPISRGTTPGLDMLLNARHFHLSKNQLSDPIPPLLFTPSMKLIHVMLDNNQLTGEIPDSLFSVPNLEVIRLDLNSLSGPVPSGLSNLTSITELNMANNQLSGPLPDFSGMIALTYVDMSNNSFDSSDFPLSLLSISTLTTLSMERTNLQGLIPPAFFSLPQLEQVVLKSNNLTGNLDIGSSYSSSLDLDLRNNSINDFLQKTDFKIDLDLGENPICQGNGSGQKFCVTNINNLVPASGNCPSDSCPSEKIRSPRTCQCTHPYVGSLIFYSRSFSDLGNLSYYRVLQGALTGAFRANALPVEAVNLSDPFIDFESYLQFNVQIFPSGEEKFNRTAVSSIGSLLNRQPNLKVDYYGPFYFLDVPYGFFSGGKKSANTGAIIGGIVAGLVVAMIILGGLMFVYLSRRSRKEHMESEPFASWELEEGNGSAPQLKGAKWLSFEELKKCTNNFSDSNCIGFGGYGKVYKGTLSSGEIVAIKRAQQGSMQGTIEFKTEIELLSRIHHKNVVSLVGFCYDQGEQMLVYEYMSKGNLRENLSGKSGAYSNWMKRLGIALDAARGLAYLHELANPPIIHRDVKSNNILLDDHFIAKVADFGLSKPLEDKGYVSTQVKGTLGYMDPEYYMTQQLTEKSDVYSFGVVLLELVTAQAPIERGKHIVRLVQETMERDKNSSAPFELLDPKLNAQGKPGGLEKFLELAMRCVRETGSERPSMGEVVREIENIIQMGRLSKTSEAEVNSFSSKGSMDDQSHHNTYGSRDFDYSGQPLHLSIDHQQ